jgi:hypothetical protein
VVRPAPAVQQKPVPTRAVTPQPAVRPAPAIQQKPVPTRTVTPQPAVRPAPAIQQKPVVTPAPAIQQKPVAPARVDQAGSSATALLATLRTRTLPDAEQHLSEARKVAGIKLDLNATAGQLAADKQALSDAEKDLAGGNSERALQKANALQKQIEDQVNRINAAIQGAKQGPQKR